MRMTDTELLDYFAAKAMQGMFAAFKRWPHSGDHEEVARHAYKAAEAMMKQREKGPGCE